MKRVMAWIFMMFLAVSLSSCADFSEESEVVPSQDVSMTAYYTTNTKIEDVINDPVFRQSVQADRPVDGSVAGDYGRLIFPADFGYYGGSTLGNLSLIWYNYKEWTT